MRSAAIFIALRTEASVTARPLTPARCTAANGATPGRRAISPSQIEFGASGIVSISPCASEVPMLLKPAGSTPMISVDGDR